MSKIKLSELINTESMVMLITKLMNSTNHLKEFNELGILRRKLQSYNNDVRIKALCFARIKYGEPIIIYDDDNIIIEVQKI